MILTLGRRDSIFGSFSGQLLWFLGYENESIRYNVWNKAPMFDQVYRIFLIKSVQAFEGTLF
jgi:hypothetical protein